MSMGVTPLQQLGPPGAGSEYRGGAGRGERVRQGEDEYHGQREDPFIGVIDRKDLVNAAHFVLNLGHIVYGIR